MKGNQQVVLLSYIVFALIIASFLSEALAAGWGAMDLRDYPIPGTNFTMTTIIAAVISAGGAVLLSKREGVWEASTEIVVELRKVTWPNIRPWFSMKSEVWAGTYVVIVTVIIFALILSLFDFFWSWMTDHIYG